ncbi:MAG: hypothetical protein JWN38_182 [Candidatus Saccharibacteria bacterium]|nr:hypothetical protein [Candidatus Saccharibacteria bacterium]
MDMNIKSPISSGATLNELPASLQTQIIVDLLYNLRQPERQRKAIEKYFFRAYVYFGVLNNLDIDGSKLENMKILLISMISSRKSYTMQQLVDDLMFNNQKASKQARLYETVIQNALVYAIAATYKALIPSIYMRAKQELPGTQLATHTDREYAAYTRTSQPLLAAFVQSNHKFWDDKILTAIGYMINPDLAEE